MQLTYEKSSSDPRAEHLYEYAIVRFMPDIERGEAVNVGLIMMCKRLKWLCFKSILNPTKILALKGDADLEALSQQLKGMEKVAAGSRSCNSPIASLEAHERFRWLTAVRSACLQTSRPHAGITHDLNTTFENLFATLIL